MTVRFVLGRAGSGKTHHCLNAIAGELKSGPEGPALIFLVPEQATFQMERALLQRNGDRAFSRARVLSFRRLAHWVFSEAGGPGTPAIGDTQRRLLLRLILRRRRADLEVFSRAASQPGFESELARLVSEFLRQRIGPDALRAVSLTLEERSDRLSGGPEANLAAKLRDLALLHEDYAREIAGRFVNPEETPEHLAEALSRAPLLAGARLWVDGFASFSAQELHALGELVAQVQQAEVCLCQDPAEAPGGETSLFAETTRTLRSLRDLYDSRGIAVQEPLRLIGRSDAGRFASAPDLAHLEREYSRLRPLAFEGKPRSITLMEAGSPRLQAEATARELLRLRSEEGYRWREMAVLTRSLDANLSHLLPAFRALAIPCFVDRRRDLDAHPLVTCLRAAARVVFGGWKTVDVLEVLKTGLTGMDPVAIERLENYALEHGIVGGDRWTQEEDWTAWPRRNLDEENPWEHPEAEQTRLETLALVNRWRREAVDLLAAWEAEHFTGAGGDKDPQATGPREVTGRRLALGLADLLRRLEAQPAIQEWEALARQEGDSARAEEHRQALDAVRNALSELAMAVGEEPLRFGEALEVVEAALEQLQIGVIPAGLDEVTVGTVDRSRQPELRAALVIGLAEGEFPGAQGQDPLLTDSDREAIRLQGCEVAPPAADLFLNESYYSYIAFTRASERLWVCRPMGDERGDELPSSPFWKRLRALFPKLEPAEAALPERDWRELVTPRQWLACLTDRRARDATRHPLEAFLAGSRLLEEVGGDPEFPLRSREDFGPVSARFMDPRARLQRDAGLICLDPVATSEARLDRGLAGAALTRDGILRVSLSQLESFTGCPFQHFAQRVLQLEERPEFKVELVDLGSLYHAVLSLWLKDILEKGETPATQAEPEIRSRICELTDRIAPRLKNELLLSNARFRYIVELVKKTLVNAARTIVASLQKGTFSPFGLELSFGMGRDAVRPLEMDLGGGVTLRLRGRIDRVDVSTDERRGDVGVCVIDYKMSGRELDLGKVYHGRDLQLAGYLLAVTRSESAAAWLGGEAVAVGAFYMPIREQSVSYSHPSELKEETADSRNARRKMRGMFDVDWLGRLEPLEANQAAIFHQVKLKKSGEMSASGSDAVDREDLAAILAHTENRIREAGQAMLEGRIEVGPARYKSSLPCDWCPYGPVCRVDSLMTETRVLPKLGRRSEALQAIREATGHGD